MDLASDKNFIDCIDNEKRVILYDKDQLVRRFTVQAFGICELLALAIKDLIKMKLEFPRVFSDLFSGISHELKHQLFLKIEVLKQGELAAATTVVPGAPPISLS